jgi:predicted aspartyl protease
MKMRRLCFLIQMGAFGAFRLGANTLDGSAPYLTRIGQPETIPAEVSSRGMYVSVMINGQGPFRMQVDTGCSISMITPEVAAAVEAHGLDTIADEAQAINALGDAVSIPRVMLDSVTLGGVQFEGVIAGVVPLELQSRVDGRGLDGLLGYSLFSELFLVLDFPRQDLLLSQGRPEDLPPARAELAIVEHGDVPFVDVRLQGREFEVMVDTGSNDRLHLQPDQVASLGWTVRPRPGFLVAVAGETGRELVARLSGVLELGGLSQKEPVVGISDGPASIGVGLLHPFCLVFDGPGETLRLCSPDDGPLPSPSERSIGLSLLADVGGWRVAGIIPDSPAEAAAIGDGDLVTKIEGQPATRWNPDQILNWINSHPAIALSVLSKSGERDIDLRTWPLVP